MILWDVMLFSLADRYQHLGGISCIHFNIRKWYGTMKVEVARSSKQMLLPVYKAVLCLADMILTVWEPQI
jgi:hypothetical protein